MKPQPYASEIKIVSLRELAPVRACNTPVQVVDFFRAHVETAAWFDSQKECLVTLLLDTHNRITGFQLVGLGTLDTVLLHPREVYRPAVAGAAASVVVAHNHPSGNPSPSVQDIEATRKLALAGDILNIRLLDHVIVGRQLTEPPQRGYTSFREMGYDLDAWCFDTGKRFTGRRKTRKGKRQ